MVNLQTMDVNYGIQTFDSSIRCRDGDPRIAWYFCDASAARREDDRFLPLPVWGHCAGYLLSLLGAFPRDFEARFLSGVRHGIPDGWQLGILFRRYFKTRGLRRDDRLPGATLHRVSSRRDSTSKSDPASRRYFCSWARSSASSSPRASSGI
jgi:hypothetical protein